MTTRLSSAAIGIMILSIGVHAQVLGGRFARICLPAGHHDARAGEHEALRERASDAASAARDDDGAIGHVEESVERGAVHVVSTTRGNSPRR